MRLRPGGRDGSRASQVIERITDVGQAVGRVPSRSAASGRPHGGRLHPSDLLARHQNVEEGSEAAVLELGAGGAPGRSGEHAQP